MKKIIVIAFMIIQLLPLFAGIMTIHKTDGSEIDVEISEICNIHFRGDNVAIMQLITIPQHADWI